MWSPRHCNGDPAFMLHFAPNEALKISYAASIGAKDIPEELKSLLMKVESEKVGLKLNIHKAKIWSHHFMGNRWGNSGNSQTLFLRAPKSLQMVIPAMKLKDTYSLEGEL